MIPTTRLPRDKDGRIDAKLSDSERKWLLQLMKEEMYPRRPAPEKRGPPTKDNPKGPIIGWPRMPPKPRKSRAKPLQPPLTAPNKGDLRSDWEIMSRLAGETTYRTPQAGRSTRTGGITTIDHAGAMGFVEDSLDQMLAVALACDIAMEWKKIESMAITPLLVELLGSHNTRGLVTGKGKYRARKILKEVFFDRVLHRWPKSTKEAADEYKMTQRDYRALYRSVFGFLETRASSGLWSGCRALFGDE